MQDTTLLDIKPHVSMKEFECTSYEAAYAYPEIRINCIVQLLDSQNGIANLSLQPLKDKILETVYYQVAAMKPPQRSST